MGSEAAGVRVRVWANLLLRTLVTAIQCATFLMAWDTVVATFQHLLQAG